MCDAASQFPVIMYRNYNASDTYCLPKGSPCPFPASFDPVALTCTPICPTGTKYLTTVSSANAKLAYCSPIQLAATAVASLTACYLPPPPKPPAPPAPVNTICALPTVAVPGALKGRWSS
jgi:hypothetical protein